MLESRATARVPVPAKYMIKPKPTRKPRLTLAQKRVAIARDVLLQIRAKKYNISQGNFCLVLDWDKREPLGKTELNRKKPVCKVCALGAAIVSSIRLYNKLNIIRGEIIPGPDIEDMLLPFFAYDQMILIENAFECGGGSFSAESADNKLEAIKFGEGYSNNEARAIAIFKNIIKHKGEFVPCL